jgi:signal transduction histidine kinase/CheY-like chemotaxis protein
VRPIDKRLMREQWITVAIALAGALAFGGLAWLQWYIVHMQRDLQVAEEIRSRWDVVRFELKRAEDLQDTVVAFFEAKQSVGREQFEAFAANLPSVNFEAISFAAYVPAGKRAEFERSTAAGSTPGSRIWELDAVGHSTTAPARDAYFPVTYMYPAPGNAVALGFDLLSEPRRRQALLAAIETGKTVRTEPIRLVQDPTQWAFLVYTPIYAQSAGSAARDRTARNVIGIVSTVYEFKSLLEKAVSDPQDSQLQVALFDTTQPSFPVFVHYAGTITHDKANLERPLLALAARSGAHYVKAAAMQNELSAVFFTDDSVPASWDQINATIIATLVIGVLLTGALVHNHVRAYRLAAQLREATEEGRARKEDAEAASLAKSRLLAYASHDLRQPLHALELFVAHLKEQPLEYATAKIVGNVDDGVQALCELLDGLLDLSRLESGSIQPVLQPTPVSELWKQLRREFGNTAEAKNLELRFRPTPVWVTTDPQLLHRILLNLVSNAVRYTAKGGVLVACRRRGSQARLEVWDTGEGIALQDSEEVFKEFVQLDNPKGNPVKGLGLGLSIVKRTAGLLSHALRMRSVAGRGSCFCVEVPIAEPIATSVAPAIQDSGSCAGCAVLVVEDDPLAARALVNLLQSWSCVVTATSNAEQARQALTDGCRPDLIVSDFRLRDGQSGIELVAQARAVLGRRVPSCIISGDTSPDVTMAADAENLIVLHKPVKAARLRRALLLLLGSPRASQP